MGSLGSLGFSRVLSGSLRRRVSIFVYTFDSLVLSWVLLVSLVFSWVLLGSLGFSWVLSGSFKSKTDTRRRRHLVFLGIS